MARQSLIAAIVVAALSVFTFVYAQESGERRGGAQRQAGERPPDVRRTGWEAQIRERWLGYIREQLEPSDAEWRKMEDAIGDIIGIQRDLRPSFSGFGRSRGGDASDEPESKLAEARSSLTAALSDKNTAPATIERRLAAFREERDKARAELEKLQKELKSVVSTRHEAVLAVNGILE